MIELVDLFVLSVFGLLGWYLVVATKRKETALHVVQQHCSQVNVQLLDGTVALRRLGLGRDGAGRLRLERRYQFEFTATGSDRNTGRLHMLGPHVIEVHLAPHRFH